MDMKDITLDQLRSENPALFAQAQQEAVKAERQRIADIDALTMEGYEAMAEEAKSNGTSALDFQKQVVAAQKQKPKDFIANRQKETAPAANVPGGAADGGKSNEQEILDNAKEIADFAKEFSASNNESMF